MTEGIKAIIFDMDGTLTDSLGIWTEADATFLERLGYDYDPSVSEAMKTLHYASACEYLKERFSLSMTVEEIAESIIEIVHEKYVNEVPLKDGVAEFMKSCADKGIKMCVATSNDRSVACDALKSLGIYDMLEFVITSDEVGCGKESPVIFEECAERMGASRSETAVFEDSVHAARSAYGAGFYTVGVYEKGYAEDFERIAEFTHKRIKSFREVI